MTFGERLEHNRRVEEIHQQLAEEMKKCVNKREFKRYDELAVEWGKHKQVPLWEERSKG
jgi:cupin superfamily acireductone dioxygenase involved in methionine salvage